MQTPRSNYASRSSLALANLRALVILIVLAFHSMLAYVVWNAPTDAGFDAPPYIWRAFPIADNHRWFGFDLFCAWQDVYLMSLMFFLSGLFVWPSLTRKKEWAFVRDRVLRLGVPYAFGVAVLMPLAIYPAYAVRNADPSIAAYWHALLQLPYWPNGPLWFLWQLLALNLIAAAVHRAAPSLVRSLGRWSAAAENRFCPMVRRTHCGFRTGLHSFGRHFYSLGVVQFRIVGRSAVPAAGLRGGQPFSDRCKLAFCDQTIANSRQPIRQCLRSLSLPLRFCRLVAVHAPHRGAIRRGQGGDRLRRHFGAELDRGACGAAHFLRRAPYWRAVARGYSIPDREREAGHRGDDAGNRPSGSTEILTDRGSPIEAKPAFVVPPLSRWKQCTQRQPEQRATFRNGIAVMLRNGRSALPQGSLRRRRGLAFVVLIAFTPATSIAYCIATIQFAGGTVQPVPSAMMFEAEDGRPFATRGILKGQNISADSVRTRHAQSSSR